MKNGILIFLLIIFICCIPGAIYGLASHWKNWYDSWKANGFENETFWEYYRSEKKDEHDIEKINKNSK